MVDAFDEIRKVVPHLIQKTFAGEKVFGGV